MKRRTPNETLISAIFGEELPQSELDAIAAENLRQDTLDAKRLVSEVDPELLAFFEGGIVRPARFYDLPVAVIQGADGTIYKVEGGGFYPVSDEYDLSNLQMLE